MHLRINRYLGAVILGLGLVATASAQSKPLPLKHQAEPTTAAITATDLMTHLYIIADDSMMGRQAGTVYNTKGRTTSPASSRSLESGPAARTARISRTSESSTSPCRPRNR